jgi:flagellar assembly protein FliH
MGAAGEIEVYEYPPGADSPLPAWDGWASAQASGPEPDRHAGHAHEAAHNNADESKLRGEFEQRIAEETRRSVEAGRERGQIEGRQSEHEAQAAAEEAREERRVRQAAEWIERFGEARDRYLQEAEQEVVKLALAVAARILRREAQMDPLLLTGAVRVALGQLVASTEVRLRVPAADLDLWNEAINLLPNLPLKPTLEAGEGMHLGDCEIDARMGSVDLGIRAQLGEIERGFFDRAGGRRVEAVSAKDLPSSRSPEDDS